MDLILLYYTKNNMIKRTLFFGNKASLTTKNKQLIVKTEAREASIPIEDIGFVVIEHQETALKAANQSTTIFN